MIWLHSRLNFLNQTGHNHTNCINGSGSLSFSFTCRRKSLQSVGLPRGQNVGFSVCPVLMEVESPAAARGVRMLPLWHKCCVALVALKVEVRLRWKVCLGSIGAIHAVAGILFFSPLLILQVPIAELQCEWQLAARCVRTCSVGDERHMKRWGLRHVFSRMETLPYWLCVSAIPYCTDTGLIDVYSSHILSIDSLLTQMCSCDYIPRMAQGISSEVQFYCK